METQNVTCTAHAACHLQDDEGVENEKIENITEPKLERVCNIHASSTQQ